jgi:GNAT superfamily N-acetyltransferase
MNVRTASPNDATIVAALLADFLSESFPGHLGTNVAVLERDVLSGAGGLRVLLAERDDVPVGFATWLPVYDLHWGKGGVELVDLCVAPAQRGVGVAIALVAAVCAAALRQGLTYLRGTSFDRASPVGRFYERIAVATDSAECHCSGKAFRRLADLEGLSPREIVKRLPAKSWNYEP